MSRSYALRQAALLGLAANAVRPVGGRAGAVPGFFAGWLTSELAPHLTALSVADSVREATRIRRNGGHPAALALGAGAAGALAYLAVSATQAREQAEEALVTGLGAGYADLAGADPADLKLPRSAVARPFRLNSRDVEVLRNVQYTEGGRRARCDIYRPRGVDLTDAPVLVQVHGGGWTIGNKEQQGLLLMNRMAQRGWVCVAVNYRLAPKHRFPTQIVDVKRAIAWTRENIAAYGGDPSYLVVTGGSAGGHLSALAALTPDAKQWQPGFEESDTSVAACVPFYGVYDMADLTRDPHVRQMRDSFLAPWVFKKSPKTDLDAFVEASPLAHVGPHAPDFFVLHGANDSLVTVRQARAFVDALRKKSDATVTYAELPGTQHAFEIFSSIRSQHVIRAVQRWLDWHRARWVAEHSPADTP